MTKTPYRPDDHSTSMAAIAVNLAVIVLVLVAALMVPRGGKALVFIPPWSGPEAMARVVSEAGGTFVTTSSTGHVAVVHSSEPGFTYRLFHAGAFMVLDGSLISACLSRETT